MEIREFRGDDLKDIERIIIDLHPEWFDDGALRNIPFDVYFQKTWVACDQGAVVGFISVYSENRNPMIGWLGVDVSRHRKGIGALLVDRAENEVMKFGGCSLRVETVVEQDPPDGTYDLTRKFYDACGYMVETKSELKRAGEFFYRMGVMVKLLSK